MRPEKSSVNEMAIPSRGFSTRYPLAKMPSDFCAWLCDYELGPGYLESRKGILNKWNADVNWTVGMYAHPTDPNKIIDVDTYSGGQVGYYEPLTGARAFYAGSVGSGFSFPKARPVGINKRVLYFFENREPIIFDGTTVTVATGLTGPTIANVVFGTTFKGRLWVVEHLSQSIWVHPTINGITGAMTEFPITMLTKDNGVIMCAFGFTLSSGLQSQSLFAFVLDSGEVFVYSGDFPAGTWALVASSRIGAPLGYQSIIEAQGDVYVLTRSGIVSMRDLFTTAGGSVQAASITFEIEKYWQQLIAGIQAADTATTYNPKVALTSITNGTYHQTKNQLVIFLPRFLKPTSITNSELGFEIETTQKVTSALVYDLSSRGWSVIKMPEFSTFTHINIISSYYSPRFDALYFGTDNTALEQAYELWGATDSRDHLLTASSNFKAIIPEVRTSFVKAKQNFNCGGVLLSHSGEAATKSAVTVNLVTEFGKTSSAACSTPQASGVSEEFYNVGGESKSFQAVVGVTFPTNGTPTKPHQIVDISLMLEPGGTLG